MTYKSMKATGGAWGAATLRAAWKLLSAGLVIVWSLSGTRAHASMTVFIGEPFGSFGRMMPVGHAAIYLDHACADGPLKLRLCRPGEQQGVVIARYHRIGRTDWIASPVMQFLYAASRPEDVLTWTTPETVWALREQYRVRYMPELVPDGTEHDEASDEWWETAGVAYNRRLWGYRLDTTPEQDERLIAALNADPNDHRYRLSDSNCADFAADLVNFVFLHAVRRTIADYGWMTPKQVAHGVWLYGQAHPELHPAVIEVPQVPGTLVRSRPAWGAAEGFLKTKTYVATLAVIQPEIPAVSLVLYLARGRFPLGKGAQPVMPAAFDRTMPIEFASGERPGSAAGMLDTAAAVEQK